MGLVTGVSTSFRQLHPARGVSTSAQKSKLPNSSPSVPLTNGIPQHHPLKCPSDSVANAADAFSQLAEDRKTVPTSVVAAAGKKNTQYHPAPWKVRYPVATEAMTNSGCLQLVCVWWRREKVICFTSVENQALATVFLWNDKGSNASFGCAQPAFKSFCAVALQERGSSVIFKQGVYSRRYHRTQRDLSSLHARQRDQAVLEESRFSCGLSST